MGDQRQFDPKKRVANPKRGLSTQVHPPTGEDYELLQRALSDPSSTILTPRIVNSLQRRYGNRFTSDLLQRQIATVEPVPVSISVASPDAIQRLTERQQRMVDGDTRMIEAAMGRMSWSGRFGPSVRVETRLSWDDPACRALYLSLKDRYDDQPIPGSSRPTLYYYFGAIGNWGKAGFRISGHNKQRARLRSGGEVTTYGVLHIEN